MSNAPSNAAQQCGPAMARTDGRTDGLTEKRPHLPEITPSSVTRAPAYGDFVLGDLLEEAIGAIEAATTRLGTPHRLEPRAEIHPWTRRSIYWRDGNQCCWCRRTFAEAGMLVLDHITPWSAGGSDRSDNLRTLCVPCNEDRSNFATDVYVRVTPVGLCDRCAARPGPDRPAHYIDPDSSFHRRIFCGRHGQVGDCTDPRRIA